MKKLFSHSIWAPGAIPPQEWKYRNMKRVMFPLVDVIFFIAGLSAIFGGAPAISEFFPDSFVDVYGIALCMISLVCLLGVSFPRLWSLEMVGKSLLLGVISGYTVSLLALAIEGDDQRSFVVYFALVAICPVVWRISLLGSEWQARKLEKKTKGE